MKNNKIIKALRLAISLSLGVASITFNINNADAGTITASTKATATISSSCQITATNINFGELGGAAQLVWSPSNGNVSVLCSNNASYTIQLNSGVNNGSASSRYMVGQKSGDKILYIICKTASFSGTWGQAGGQCTNGPWYTQGSFNYPVTGKGTGVIQNYPTYGGVQSGYYTPDTYTDTITATITY